MTAVLVVLGLLVQLALILALLVVVAALSHRLAAVQDELRAEERSLANARRAMRLQAEAIESVKSWARTEGRLDAEARRPWPARPVDLIALTTTKETRTL